MKNSLIDNPFIFLQLQTKLCKLSLLKISWVQIINSKLILKKLI